MIKHIALTSTDPPARARTAASTAQRRPCTAVRPSSQIPRARARPPTDISSYRTCDAGLSESLNAEIRPLGLRSICVDLGYFRTSFLDPNNRAPYTNRIADYKAITVPADERWKCAFPSPFSSPFSSPAEARLC